MANTQSAAKRARQTLKRSVRNRSVRSRLRNLQKEMRATEKPDVSRVRDLISAIDKAAKKGILHRNAARRRKASLNHLLGAGPRSK